MRGLYILAEIGDFRKSLFGPKRKGIVAKIRNFRKTPYFGQKVRPYLLVFWQKLGIV